jgi:uncharacterized membrane-anchored protein YhcB (DUF1043 family)
LINTAISALIGLIVGLIMVAIVSRFQGDDDHATGDAAPAAH